MDNFDDDDDDYDDGSAISRDDKIAELSVRRDALNKSLNMNFRMLFKELATESNPVPESFCSGVIEPDTAQIEYMKKTILGNQIDDANMDNKTTSADNSLAGVIYDKMNDIGFSKASLKAIKNAVNHLLVMIGLPKILDNSKHQYPKMMKVYGHWVKHIKENPVKSKQAASIESDTLKAMKSFIPSNDWERMAQFYVTNTTSCGQRGIEAQHQLKTENLSPVESKFKKGKKGEKNPRHMMVVYPENKNGSEFFETIIVCTCSDLKFTSFNAPCIVGCPCGIIKRYHDRLSEMGIVNVYPSLPKPRLGYESLKSGMFNEKHKSPESHTGVNTLPKFLNALNELLPDDSRSKSHFSGHSSKQTHISNSLDAGISPESLAITTNNNLSVLIKEYAKGKGHSTKVQNSITLNTHLEDSEEPPSKKIKTSLKSSFPIASSSENSQSTTDSVIIARHRHEKENKKHGNIVASSSSSSSNKNQYQLPLKPQIQLPPQVQPVPPQVGHAPVFNFYTNYNPNPIP